MSKNPPLLTQYVVKGFTLAELLVALMILAVIATFSIPKVLQTEQNQRWNAEGKEVIATIAQALQQAKLEGSYSSASYSIQNLSSYLNYVSYTTTGNIDDIYGLGSIGCSVGSGGGCFVLHNGGKLMFYLNTFGSGNTNVAQFALFDPDGKVTDGTTNGPGKSLKIAIYGDGFITSLKNLRAGTVDSTGYVYGSCSQCDPSWFNWN